MSNVRIPPSSRIFQEMQPRMTPEICEGVATHQLKGLHYYLDTIIRSTAEDLFCPGLTYDGFEICSPLEALQKAANLPRRPNFIALEKSDTYMVKLNFSFQGRGTAAPKKIESQYLMLPYVGRGGIITIRGSKFVISPALIDNVFTVEDKNIFIQFTRSRDNFQDTIAWYKADGVPNDVRIVYSHLHRDNTKKNLNTSWKPVLVNYIFAYYGVTNTFKRYCGVDVVAGGPEINNDTYPKEDWVIYTTMGNRSEKKGRGNLVTQNFATEARLAIPRKQVEDEPAGLSAMIGGFFYTLDWVSEFPFSLTFTEFDNTSFWKRCLLRFIFKNVTHERTHLPSIEMHLESLQYYVDVLFKRRLNSENIAANDTVDLFAYLNSRFTHITSRADPASVEGKVLESTRFVMHGLIQHISKLGYELDKLEGNRLTENSIIRIMRKQLAPDRILSIVSEHGIVRSAETATDCMLMNITLPVATQEAATGSNRKPAKKDAEMFKPSVWLHETIPLAHSFLAVKKSAPSGRGLANPFANIDRNYSIRMLEGAEEMIKNLGDLLKGKDDV